MKNKLPIINITSFIFLTNFLWEISQMFLYENHTNGLVNFIWVHIKASLGDMIIILLIYILGTLALQNKKWFLEKNNGKYFLASLFGFAIAVAVEKYAISTGRWAYNDLMPIIPFFKVGLIPILQMIILPSLTILFLEKSITKNSRR